jgi:hypothetical protein
LANITGDMNEDDKMIYVWKVQLNGSTLYFPTIQDVCGVIECDTEDFADGEKATITRVRMSEEKFLSLPEFEGY